MGMPVATCWRRSSSMSWNALRTSSCSASSSSRTTHAGTSAMMQSVAARTVAALSSSRPRRAISPSVAPLVMRPTARPSFASIIASPLRSSSIEVAARPASVMASPALKRISLRRAATFRIASSERSRKRALPSSAGTAASWNHWPRLFMISWFLPRRLSKMLSTAAYSSAKASVAARIEEPRSLAQSVSPSFHACTAAREDLVMPSAPASPKMSPGFRLASVLPKSPSTTA
mmetsp:Transcript_7394/g.18865  ORF Transcript_7394/g.18865 Transcript_7394/m.18865 type:complete len:232 (-) Transcript_7394:1167-1862(-)